MRFGEYLISRGKIGEKEILEAVAQQRSYHKVIGQLAIEKDLLSPQDVARIRGIQRDEERKFGEISINLNLLTPEQVESLLKIQKNNHQFLGQILVTQGRLTPEELVAELRKFTALRKLEKKQKPKTILVASPSAMARQTAASDFNAATYRVIEARNGDKTIEMARLHKPGLIVLDRKLPAAGGYEVCRMLREEPDTRFIPVVMLARHAEEIDHALGFQVGAVNYFLFPFRKGSLEKFVDKLLELDETQREHMLMVVDDNPMTRHSLKYLLLREGFEVIDLETTDDILQDVASEVDCIVFAFETSGSKGLKVARELRRGRAADQVPVVFIATEESRPDVIPLLGTGINDLVILPFRQEELVARLQCHASYKKMVDRLDLQRELLLIQKAELEETSRRYRELLKKWKLVYRGHRRILDSITDILVVIDTDYKIMVANPGALQTLGVQREEDLVGRTCHELFTGTDRVCDDCAAKRVLEKGGPARCVRHWTLPGSGSKEMEEKAFPILNSRREVMGVVVYARQVEEGGSPVGQDAPNTSIR